MNQYVDHIDNLGNINVSPYQTEYYLPSGVFTHNHPGDLNGSITGEIIQPTYQYLGIDKAWVKGITGMGVKVCVIDDNYDVSYTTKHEDVPVIASFNCAGQANAHSLERLGEIGAKRNGKGLMGVAYDCDLYSAASTTLFDSLAWGYAQGCRIFNCSFDLSVSNDAMKLAIRKLVDDGCIVNFSAGNSRSDPPGTSLPINEIGGHIGTTMISGTFGGATVDFQDIFVYDSQLPVNGKGIDFVIPASSITCTTSVAASNPWTQNNWYNQERGTSGACAIFSGICALMMQKYPNLPGRNIINLIKIKSRKVTINGIQCYSPQNIF